ncbi:MAG: dipicolinate synthase subunit B [Oscillospiraceae bacterium]|jgi:dipicolinate synthase subunit B|nr:dipicolinate synthase subunit B [Oscillospiraceae bacterium]
MRASRVGFALCGSYCTFDRALAALGRLCALYDDVTPLMSENAYSTDTRFGAASGFISRVEELCGKPVIHDIASAEPIGPRALLDVLVIAPCTGNTLSKLAHGITDTCVTMAAKAHLRNSRPLLLAVSTNDALSGSAPALGALLARKNVYFAPFYQDDPEGKPASLLSDLECLNEAVEAALEGRQLQPLLTSRRA